jgi:ribosomal protein S21
MVEMELQRQESERTKLRILGMLNSAVPRVRHVHMNSVRSSEFLKSPQKWLELKRLANARVDLMDHALRNFLAQMDEGDIAETMKNPEEFRPRLIRQLKAEAAKHKAAILLDHVDVDKENARLKALKDAPPSTPKRRIFERENSSFGL